MECFYVTGQTTTTMFSNIHLILCLFVSTISAISSTDAIRNTLGRYPLAIDSKSFGDLAKVFTVDAIGNYSDSVSIIPYVPPTPPPTGVYHGLPAIQAGIKKYLASVKTQHMLGTQVIDVFEANGTAITTTYYIASHFGTKLLDNQLCTAHAKYEDYLVNTSEGWRIAKRTVKYLGPLTGNPLIFL